MEFIAKSVDAFPLMDILIYGRGGAYIFTGIGAFIAPFISNVVIGYEFSIPAPL